MSFLHVRPVRARKTVRSLLYCGLFLVPCLALGQTGDETFGFLDIGRSYTVLGARADRTGGILGVGLVRDDPKLKWHGPKVRFVETAYLMNHYGHDDVFDRTDTYAVGATYGLRLSLARASRLFLQYDFGVQFDSHRSYGLPSEFNVTPWLTLGSEVPGRRPFEFGVSAMHISNMYTQRPNFGQDFLFAFVGIKI